MKNPKEIKKIVKEGYKKIAIEGSGCGCSCKNSKDISKSIGYLDEDLKIVKDANLGLGCGNPIAFSKIKEGDTVLDLGCGAGIDCFLAAKKVGENGQVIGVDMTEEMIKRGRLNGEQQGLKNLEF